MKRKLASVSIASLIAVTGGVALPGAAHASTACDGYAITINGNPGAEPPSRATGHTHRTGNHYVRYIYSNGVWEWWADNNGGSNGDTVDTYYGSRQC